MRSPYGKRMLCAVTAALLLFAGGCSFGMDVGTLMRAPRPAGVYESIQETLETYITNNFKSEGVSLKYTLKYPHTSGENRSAFIMEDMDRDGQDEAIVFYSVNSKTNVRLHYLHQQDGQWVSVHDVEGESSDINRIEFSYPSNHSAGVLLLVGWSYVKTLSLYSLTDDGLEGHSIQGYLEWTTGEFRGAGLTDLMIVYEEGAGDDRQVKAGLFSHSTANILTNHSTVLLDNAIQSVSTMTLCALPSGRRALYADARRGNDTVTALVYWDGNTLVAPLDSDLTKRSDSVPSMDIDGTGQYAWPELYSAGAVPARWDSSQTLPVTSWHYWDFSLSQPQTPPLQCAMNWRDGYYVRLSDAGLRDAAVSVYDPDSRSLYVYQLSPVPENAGNSVQRRDIEGLVLVVQAVYTNEMPSLPQSDAGEALDMALLAEFEGVVSFRVWTSDDPDFNFSDERLQMIINYLY